MGTQHLPSPKRGRSPQFSAHVYCDQASAWIKMPLCTEVGLGLGDIVLDGTQLPLPKEVAEPPPQFSAHVYCFQTAEWIKMAIDMEVGLSPRHIVLDGDLAPLPKKGDRAHNFRPIFNETKLLDASRCHLVWRLPSAQATLCSMGPSYPQNKGHTHHHPIFGPRLLWTNGWMDEDATWYGSRPRPRPDCIRPGLSSPRNGHSSPPLFGPCIVAMVADLGYC